MTIFRKLSAAEKLKARKRVRANRDVQRQTKLGMIQAARAAEDTHWPKYLWPDITHDAWFHRKSINSAFLEERGGFSHHMVTLALTDPDWETKESVAAWLRDELKLLREAEVKPGMAPVRRGKALSRTEISEIAIELLECVAGESLICLFQELLDIDRHRKSLAESFLQLEHGAEIEAKTRLQGKQLGVRQLAALLSVSPSTVTRWRKSSTFHERVKFHDDVWSLFLREEYFDEIKSAAPGASEQECFRRAFRLYYESISARRAGKI